MLLFAAAQLRAETTIYAAKHFEVRDHDAPVKYVFNGSTRVARITGSLSINTRIQRFRLHAGWNLLSLAVGATNLSEQLQRSGVVASAHSWNAQAGTYSPVPQVAPSGMVLWINATTNTTLGVVGTYADPVHRQIPAGATYLATTGLEAWTPTLPPSVAAWSFDSQPPVRRSFSGGGSSFSPQPTWHTRLTGDLSSLNDLSDTFAPGQAVYVISQAPFELEIPNPALRVRYYHQDHLGSSSVMTDASGALVEETAFYPFGIPRHEHRLRSIEEHYKYTQKERDHESGLFYFEARYLTAGLARFAVPDPKYVHPDTLVKGEAAGFFANPQKLNLYAYARGNPLTRVDPTGLDDEENTTTVWDVIKNSVDKIESAHQPLEPRPNAGQSVGPKRGLQEDPCKQEYQAFLDAIKWKNDPKSAEICPVAQSLADSKCEIARLKPSRKTANDCVQETIRAQEKCGAPQKGVDVAGKLLDVCLQRNNAFQQPRQCPMDRDEPTSPPVLRLFNPVTGETHVINLSK